MLWESSEYRVLLVSPSSNLPQRKRAERIALRCRLDTGFDFAPYHAKDTKYQEFPLVFIGVSNGRAISFLVLRKTKVTAKVKWEEYYNQSAEDHLHPDKRWGISMIWVLEEKRRMGYARKLLQLALGYVDSPVLETAWFTEFTESGEQLAQYLLPDEIILTV